MLNFIVPLSMLSTHFLRIAVSYVCISCFSLLYLIHFVHMQLAYIQLPLVNMED